MKISTIILIIFVVFQLYYLINGCVFSSYVHIKRFRIRGSLVCFENYNSSYFFRIKLGIVFPNQKEYLLDVATVDWVDGTFSLFGSCMIPKQFASVKLKLFLRISRESFVKERDDRLRPLNFKQMLNYLVELGDNCFVYYNRRQLYFADDIELVSNNGILNMFNLYIGNHNLYDIFGPVDELTGLLIANDEGKSDSQNQLPSFWRKIKNVTGKERLYLG